MGEAGEDCGCEGLRLCCGARLPDPPQPTEPKSVVNVIARIARRKRLIFTRDCEQSNLLPRLSFEGAALLRSMSFRGSSEPTAKHLEREEIVTYNSSDGRLRRLLARFA